MTVKTIHQDTHGDKMRVYESHNKIHIDGSYGSGGIAWRGIFTTKQAREIARRLNDLADIVEGN